MTNENNDWITLLVDHAKAHVLNVCSPGVRKAVFDDLTERFGKVVENPTKPKYVELDLPGIASMKRKTYNMGLEGIEVVVPATDVAYFYEVIKNLEIREDAYYKITTWRLCFCVSPDERKQILSKLEEIYLEADVIANTENEQFNEAMANLNSPYVAVRPRVVKDTKKFDA